MGSLILVKTRGGTGTKDVTLVGGEYKGTLIDFDGTFIKLEYETKKFWNKDITITKETILINLAYVITLEEYKEKSV